jgi:aminocarboxymuconate-semialdehyde decarboxylase
MPTDFHTKETDLFYTCSPQCTDPSHKHGKNRSAAATASANKAKASASRPIVRNRAGKSKVIDLHCHYLNPVVNAKTAHLKAGQYDPTVIFANELTNQTNVKQMQTRAPKLTGVEERLKDMDRMGIDIQAVCPAPYHFFYFTEAGYGAELAREVNEGIAQLAADHPDRFVGLGSVPLQNAELAVRELDYAVKNLGLRGVEICTNVNGKNLTDPSLNLEKFFARCAELGVVVFMHPLGYTQGERLTNHYFNNVIGNPLESTVAVSHLIFDGVMARHPKLKVIVAHGGGFIAHYWARMDHAWRARPDCRTVIKRKPSSYLEKFYFDTITHDPEMLKRLIERFGADHVVLGTDYPYDMADDDPLGMVAQVKRLARADRELVVGGNAARLLKIKL